MLNPISQQQETITRLEEEIPSEQNRLQEERRFASTASSTGTRTLQNQANAISSSSGAQVGQIIGEPKIISSVPLTSATGITTTQVGSLPLQSGVPLQTGVPITSDTITTTTTREFTHNVPFTQSTVPFTQSTVYDPQRMESVVQETTTRANYDNLPPPDARGSLQNQTQYTSIQNRTMEVTNQPVIEGISEIPHLEEHMKDSVSLGRPTESPTHVSKWDAQMSTMKYESHQNFENWEANRNLFVTDRLNIMDDLLDGMDKKLEWLDLGMQKVILFFKEREAQEMEFSRAVKHNMTQLGDHFERGDITGIIDNFTLGMKENDAWHATIKKNSEILGLFIKKDILDWVLIPSEKEYKIQCTSLRTPTHNARRRLASVETKRSRLYNKYFKLYDDINKHPTKPTTKENLIFKRQLKYSLAAREELRMLRLYGEQGLLVLQEFVRLATVRMTDIQKCFSLYLQKYIELFKTSTLTPEPILELIERANNQEDIQRLFSVRNLLSTANYVFLQNQLGREEISYLDLTPFLQNFPESIDPARSSFVLREWDAVKEGSFFKGDRACCIVATTGNSLLIIEKKKQVEQELGKVDQPYQMGFTKVENVVEGVDGTTLQVVERTPGTLFTHTHKVKLKFETPEEASSFLMFMNQNRGMVGEV